MTQCGCINTAASGFDRLVFLQRPGVMADAYRNVDLAERGAFAGTVEAAPWKTANIVEHRVPGLRHLCGAA